MIEDKDLGLKIGNDIEALWADVVEKTEAILKARKEDILVNEAILEMAKEKLENEKTKG